MHEWIVRVEGTVAGMDDDTADALLDALAAYAPALSYRPDAVSLTLTIEAESPQQAVQEAAAALVRTAIMPELTRVEAGHAA